MVKADLWDRDAWKGTLHKWEHWTKSHNVSSIRNQIAFHVNRDRLSYGLKKIPKKDVFIYRSDSLKNQEGWFEVAMSALLKGTQSKVSAKQLEIDLNSVFNNLWEYLAVGEDLANEFIRVLNVVGVKPIIVVTKGGKPSPISAIRVQTSAESAEQDAKSKKVSRSGSKTKAEKRARKVRKASKDKGGKD
jgi:hypothetical protein